MSKKVCSRCGKKLGWLEAIDVENRKYCPDCSKTAENEVKQEEERRNAVTAEDIQGVVTTTAPYLEGYRIDEYLSIVNAQVVLGVDAWRDLAGSLRSWAGGRSESLEKELRAGFALANEDLKKEAYLVNANAVIAAEFDGGMEVAGDSGSNDKMMMITATGTAVIAEKEND